MDAPSKKPKPLKREYDKTFVVTPEYQHPCRMCEIPVAKNGGARVPILKLESPVFVCLSVLSDPMEDLAVETKVTEP